MSFNDELSNDELRARLRQRGLSEEMVESIVANRDSEEGMRRITEELRL